MPKPLTFQELIQKLNDYWARQGCLVMQPYDLEVGADFRIVHQRQIVFAAAKPAMNLVGTTDPDLGINVGEGRHCS